MRTTTSESSNAGPADIRTGRGVVYDSVPATEFEETVNKARAMLKAVDIAENQL